MLPNLSKYLLGTFLILVICLSVALNLKEKRIKTLKAENNQLILQLKSVQYLTEKQVEQLGKLKTQLATNEELCNKRVNARSVVKSIFKKPENSVETKLNIKNIKGENINEFITFNESVAAIDVINSYLRLQ